MDNSNLIRIIIVDDLEIVVQGFVSFLGNIENFEIVDTARTGQDAINLCRELEPDVVLMDAIMPGISGIEATGIIKQENPDIQIIVVTSKDQKKDLVPRALKAGATGFLLKSASPEEVAHTIRMAYEGKTYLSQEVTQILVDAALRSTTQQFNLTERELDVLRRIAKGKTNQEIADDLTITLYTVKYHVSNVLSKLNVRNRNEALVVANEHNLLDPSALP